jgi:uncharacterized protein (TIGR04222 family)
MAEDTWGISGPAFMTGFVAATAVLIFVIMVARWIMSRGSADLTWQADVEHYAYFTGGPRQAVLAAVAGLRLAGAIDSRRGGTLIATGYAPPGCSRLTAAVHRAIHDGRGQLTALTQEPPVRQALDDLEGALVQHGWLLSAHQRRAIRRTALLLLVPVAVGGARIMAGLLNDKQVGYLLIATVMAAVVTSSLHTAPTHARSARRAVAGMRSQYRHLRPSARPAMGMYGAGAAALSVALFGSAALWAADPAFAAEANIARNTGGSGSDGAGGDGGGSDGGSGDGGGGGGCGGGGCGG